MEVTFHLPSDYELPEFYSKQTPEQIALALRLGAESVDYMVKNATDILREETNEQTAKKLEDKYTLVFEKQKNERKKLEDSLETAKEQIANLERANASWQKDLRQRAESMMEPVLRAKDKEIEDLKEMLRMIQDLGLKFDKMNDSYTKTQNNSYLKGRAGEFQVEELLKMSLDCEIYPVHKEAYAGDYHMIRGKGKYKYLIDSKDYSRMVNQQEIEKLHRDLRINADVVGAIMISLNSGITGHSRSGDIDIEFNELGKPIVYIGNLKRRDEIPVLFAGLRPFFEVVEQLVHHQSTQATTESEVTHKLQQQVALVSNLIRSHLQSLLNMKNVFVNHKKKTDAMYNEQLSLLLQQEGTVKNLLAVALGDSEQLRHAVQDSQMPLPSSIFSKTARTDLTEQENKFVEWMETTFVFEDGKDLDLKIFMEKAMKDGWKEKEFRGMREKLFTESAWAKGGKKVYGIVLRHTT
jgi:hypothetical protein